ncbi:MAG TPA: pyridoxal-phosphate dependent enzyme [Solirubrobacterales bacterium]|nr:pyridoxal-phosphate dependent enzyme [Solirubrobacterales bacterium]
MPRLHELYPELKRNLPSLRLGTTPTPLRRLPGLGDGAAEIWLKDEGAFGDGGWGGNKVRKLEWLIPEARRRGRTTLLTVGGLGTNWGLACALYGREHGLKTVLALVDQPLDDHVRAQLERLEASGAELHFTHTKARTIAAVPWLMVRHRPYLLPAGGSSPIGALGAVEIALELAAQVERGEMPEPSHVVTAVGSGGTAAGLLLGLRLAGLDTKVLAVVVNDTLRLDSTALTRLARKSERLLRGRGADPPVFDLDDGRLIVVDDQLGTGYGHPTTAAERAHDLAADLAGLDLDPVYTAKAMAGLLELNDGRLGSGPIVFIDTNGPRP